MSEYIEEPTEPSAAASPTVSIQAPKQEDEYALIPLDQVEPDPEQPRKTIHDKETERLAGSIKNLGLLQPIVVRRLSETSYRLIAGERRFRAHQLLKLPTIKALVRSVDDSHTILITQLAENDQRVVLDNIELAAAVRRDVEETGISKEALAEQLNWSRQKVSEYLNVARAPSYVQRYGREHKVKAPKRDEDGALVLDIRGRPTQHEYRLPPLAWVHLTLLARYDARLRRISVARQKVDGGLKDLPFERLVTKLSDKCSLQEWSRRKLDLAIRASVESFSDESSASVTDESSSKKKAFINDKRASFSTDDLEQMDTAAKNDFAKTLTELLKPFYESVIINS